MQELEVKVKADTTELDEAIKKAEILADILKEADKRVSHIHEVMKEL